MDIQLHDSHVSRYYLMKCLSNMSAIRHRRAFYVVGSNKTYSWNKQRLNGK